MSLKFAALSLALSLPAYAESEITLTPKARKIHNQALLIDGHNDLAWALREKDDMELKTDLRKVQKDLHTDIPKLRQGGLGAQFWSAYVPAQTMFEKTSLRMTLEQIDLIHRIVDKYSDTFEMASTTSDIRRIRANGKIASMIGVEGGHSMENSLSALRTFYKLGVRYMTITHSRTLGWADSATDDKTNGGLTAFGKDVIGEMNRLGMLVDISHVSPETMDDVLDASLAPVIFSHSSAKAVANHERNVPDKILKRLKKNGGVVMVNFYSGFVDPKSAELMKDLFEAHRKIRAQHTDDEKYEKAWKKWKEQNPYPKGNVKTVVDHIDHIVKVAGIDHVGIGADYDGVSQLPHQLEDVSGYPFVTQELLNRGYKESDIKKVLGENLMNAMSKAENIAAKLQKQAHSM